MTATKKWKPGADELPQTIRARQEAKRTDAILQDEHFIINCEKAGIKPTRRQARKWLHGQGLAQTFHTEAKETKVEAEEYRHEQAWGAIE